MPISLLQISSRIRGSRLNADIGALQQCLDVPQICTDLAGGLADNEVAVVAEPDFAWAG